MELLLQHKIKKMKKEPCDFHSLKLAVLMCCLLWQTLAKAQNDSFMVKYGDKNYMESNDWTGSGAVKGVSGGESRWTTTEGAYMFAKADLAVKGRYEVAYWKSINPANTRSQKINIYHNGKLDSKTVDLVDGKSGWEILGIYDFALNGNESVGLKTGAESKNVRFSAVKFTLVDKSPITLNAQPKPAPIYAEDKASYVKDVAVVDGFSITKNWNWSMLVKSPIEKEPKSLYTAKVGATAIWNPKIYSLGKVRVSIFRIVDETGNDPKVPYELLHNNKRDTIIIDFTKGTSGWQTLGVFDFNGGSNEYLKLTKVTPKVVTRASTVKFEILNAVSGGDISVWSDLYVNANTNIDLSGVTERKIAFVDINDQQQKLVAEFLANRKIFSGRTKDSFDPNGKISIADFAGIMAKASGIKDSLLLLKSIDNAKGVLTEPQALQMMQNVLLTLNKNIDWSGDLKVWSLDATKMALKTGLLQSYEPAKSAQPLNRISAAILIKRFLELHIWAGPPVDKKWALTFKDDFNGASLNFDVWESQNSPSNNLLSSRWKENNVVEDGILKMVIKKEQRGGQQWTSSHIWVKPKVFAQTYGYWEARYRYAKTPGLNQAWWLYGVHDYILGPKSFEIDINEGHYPQYINMTLHPGKNEKGENEQFTKRYETNEDLSADFHVYGLEWNEKELIYYFDGKIVDRKPVYNAHLPTSPRFSTAVINWAGPVQDSMDGKSMDVDWIRVYARKP